MIPSLLDTEKIARLTEKQSEIYLRCCLWQELELQKGNSLPFGEKESKDLGPMGQILYYRLQAYGGSCNLPVAMILTMLAGGVPGVIVMYGYAMAILTRRLGKSVDMTALSEAFPLGFPSTEGCEEIWEAQKTDTGQNRLDMQGYARS